MNQHDLLKLFEDIDSKLNTICNSNLAGKMPRPNQRKLRKDTFFKKVNDAEKTGGSKSASIASTSAQPLFYSKKVHRYYSWIDSVFGGLQPFYIVQKPVFRRNARFDCISRNALLKYMGNLTKRVESKISSFLFKIFALVFEGWSAIAAHYVGVFASLCWQTELGYDTCLLVFSLFDDEITLNAETHVSFIEFVLQEYEKIWENVACIVGNNCSANHLIAKTVGKMHRVREPPF